MLHYVWSRSVFSVSRLENKFNKLFYVADGQLCVKVSLRKWKSLQDKRCLGVTQPSHELGLPSIGEAAADLRQKQMHMKISKLIEAVKLQECPICEACRHGPMSALVSASISTQQRSPMIQALEP